MLVPFFARLSADGTIWTRAGGTQKFAAAADRGGWQRYLVAPVRDAIWLVVAAVVVSVVITPIATQLDSSPWAMELATVVFVGSVIASGVWFYLRLHEDDERRRNRLRDQIKSSLK
jgi:hypothetical protein